MVANSAWYDAIGWYATYMVFCSTCAYYNWKFHGHTTNGLFKFLPNKHLLLKWFFLFVFLLRICLREHFTSKINSDDCSIVVNINIALLPDNLCVYIYWIVCWVSYFFFFSVFFCRCRFFFSFLLFCWFALTTCHSINTTARTKRLEVNSLKRGRRLVPCNKFITTQRILVTVFFVILVNCSRKI